MASSDPDMMPQPKINRMRQERKQLLWDPTPSNAALSNTIHPA